MATADRPCTRDTNRKEPGFYKRLLEDQLDGSESYNEKDIAVGEDNVFEVERLLELKNVKVSGGHQLSPHSVDFILTGHHILFCAMEGLPQRGCFMDSSFSDYGHCHQVGVHSVHRIYSNNFLLLFRMFHDPQPPLRTVLDAVSSFVSIIHSSLHAGIIARRTVSLEFPKFVFNFLFKK